MRVPTYNVHRSEIERRDVRALSTNYVLKGNLCYCKDRARFQTAGYLVCENGIWAGAFDALPERYAAYPLTDYGDKLILPGLCDLHVHAPQFAYRGLGMDLELLEWLNTQAFPEEAKYADEAYAARAYGMFVGALKRSATTRVAVFATLHTPATLMLMQMLEQAGLRGYVGRVSMNRNSPANLCEASEQAAAEDEEAWIRQANERFQHVLPIVTPRFVPSCTDGLMQRLQALRERYGLPLQSHLSENHSEIDWVRELCPDAKGYADAYDRFGMLEGAIMAHVVYPTDEEIALLAERGAMVAHCPASNMNIRSGIAPVRKLLNAGVRVGLGSDVAGGQTVNLFRAITDAIQVSKLYWRLIDQDCPPLTLCEAFYLATKGGGAYFGNVGGFEAGYEADAIVVDDGALAHPQPLTTLQRLERAVYLYPECKIVQKYIAGKPILCSTAEGGAHGRWQKRQAR